MVGINYSKIDKLPKCGELLMRIFIRFEFSMKDCGYLMQSENAHPDWNCFSQSLGNDFFETIKAKVPTLVESPPKQQIKVGDSLEWKEAEPVINVQMLFEAVRRVRNNLLHGGKSGDPDNDRNDVLVVEALTVLDYALIEHPIIRTPFEGLY